MASAAERSLVWVSSSEKGGWGCSHCHWFLSLPPFLLVPTGKPRMTDSQPRGFAITIAKLNPGTYHPQAERKQTLLNALACSSCVATLW